MQLPDALLVLLVHSVQSPVPVLQPSMPGHCEPEVHGKTVCMVSAPAVPSPHSVFSQMPFPLVAVTGDQNSQVVPLVAGSPAL